MHFSALHQQPAPLLIANVWDVPSARAAHAAGYQVIGTSSAAVSDAFGYQDGEGMSFAELKQVIARLRACCVLPLTVDMEAGYGETDANIVNNLVELADLGVVGVNLEDSLVRDGQRSLLDVDVFVRRLRAIRSGLSAVKVELFLNVRTDAFLLGHADAQQEAISRGQAYAAAGADGLFVPCVTRDEDIAAIAREVSLPLNVMCMPGLPDFARLAALGVKRISMGNFVHQQMQDWLRHKFQMIQSQQSFDTVFAHASH